MPPYPGVALASVPVASNASPIQLQKGESCYVVGKLAAGATQLPVNDQNVAGENFAGASIAVELAGGSEALPPAFVSVEARYAGAPGAGESLAIQEADTDADAFYVTPAATPYTLATFSANNVGRSDLPSTGGRFLRVVRTIGAGNQPATIKITRLA